ncbi:MULTISPECIES: efflux RND transporter periplasmic adaptor subunit [unclassified Arcicella]|uniref:efflux RND transporter periplasmic adaptor subunit n=1 Tax=unclassified Arcicella TaxID=2644986 RepID=UPI002854BAB7|nr:MULTISPECIES: efflux RND transporter periplasmic adaptor subunit [unclassified Arcicella]MDR6563841.1 Cu(I)/Ag(I) efflux system membrane fusion protein [Arcicella sp. BE51]MDR6813475.1 Cu(I)/Ag(I) efflux system membrane fusion protein [Arcicella sp. BE140]MDR6824788.1 Cu(I)/Ag(I) efflux system membrane fusion protein [Arcicella sp. BE139]
MKSLNIIFFILLALIGCNTINNNKTQVVSYTCPMPSDSVFSDKPGKCPKCGMKLIKFEEHSDNNKTDEDAAFDFLLKPTDEFAISSIPLITLQDSTVNVLTKALGIVSYDKNYVGSISSRIAGRIEKLLIRYQYQKVNKGQKIMEIYSPELLTEQQNLIFLLKNDKTNITLIDASKQRLHLLGVDDKDIQNVIKTLKSNPYINVYANYTGHLQDASAEMQISNAYSNSSMNSTGASANNTELKIKEGMYVQKGQTVFTIFNQDKVYALLSIYNDDVSLIQKGISVELTPESNAGRKIYGKIDVIEPFYRNENKNQTVRVYFNNKSLQLPIGSQVKAAIMTEPKHSNWVASTSVLDIGLENVVLKKYQQGLVPVKVKTGIKYNNLIEITNGLTQNDSIAINAQFLMDSESFIKIKK